MGSGITDHMHGIGDHRPEIGIRDQKYEYFGIRPVRSLGKNYGIN
jgi:hypothetical protein